MKSVIVVSLCTLVFVGSASAGRPTTVAGVVAALQSRLMVAESKAAAKLPGRPAVSCDVVSGNSHASKTVQCWAARAGGRPVSAVSALVPCGLAGEVSCASPGACVYLVSVFAPPPRVVATLSVNICSLKS